ncbi:MAG: hypothetical protein EBR22_03695 [Cytophagia bacterium]|nr:hypothetical protein [Cytophagia bacterium]
MPHPLDKIVQISGTSGLHRVLTTSKQGYLLESLESAPRRWHAPSQSKVAALAEIAIYTQDDQVPLWDVFCNLHNMGMTEAVLTEALANENSLVALFKQALPAYDSDRVYVSDMRKTLRWFLALQGRVDFTAPLEKESETEAATE